jgi:hypothetical protein
MAHPDDETEHRTRHRAAGDQIHVREAEEVEDDEDVFEIRMPIASTGDVRNDGDDPLTRAELEGMARQIGERAIGVFPAHGMDDMIASGHYSPFERMGDWQAGEFQARSEDGDDGVLMATARMPDPETLPAATGDYREALAILKEQAMRGVAQDSSIGWRDDDSFPGGVDLMEVSIVGIGADWRTNTGDEQAEVVAREAVAAGADPDELVGRVADAVDSERPLGPPGDEDRFDTYDECVDALADDPDLSREDAEDICGAWEAAKEGRDSDTEDSDDMTDDDDPGDEQDAGTTDEEQDDQPDTERAPGDVSEDDLLTFTATHFDGMDEGDLMQAVDAADAEYIGECDAEALFDFVSIVTGAEYGTVEDAMGDLMDSEGEQEGDKPDDYEDDEDDEDGEQAADPDTEQDADGDSDVEERVAELESELEAIRTGDAEITTPQQEQAAEADDEDAADAQDDTTERDAAESPTDGLGDYR